MADINKLEELAKLVRYFILEMTTNAGSGHLTSSLSATDLMTALFFEKLRFDIKNPQNPDNDRVIFSKGHASPLLYALYAAAGEISKKELSSYRRFKSPLEGHPIPRLKFVEAATGSLGQGLSVGVGMALAAKLEKLTYITYVLLGDSETAEGSVWEAMALASYYKLGNLVGIIDVNRLGQSGQTMLGYDLDSYKRRVEAFGWEAKVIDGHDLDEIVNTFDSINGLGGETFGKAQGKPVMIIAKTIKGKGVSFIEDKEGWHGRPLQQEDFKKAVKELGKINFELRGEVAKPIPSFKSQVPNSKSTYRKLNIPYNIGDKVATRKAFGEALAELGDVYSRIVSLDAEVKNSTFSEIFKEKHPERFFEMFIAEQNMVGTALGLSKRGKIPFVSTFGVFLTRAFDQIRMSAYSGANIKFIGSHAGVSIGEDGPSQMALQDIAMFRTIDGSIILYPADGIATWRMVELAAKNEGIFYIRTQRPATPIIYQEDERFEIGGSKVVRSSSTDQLTVVACGVTLNEAIKACDKLKKQNINVRIIDVYSIKPIDEKTLKKSAGETNHLIITVEDHYFEGGLGDSVLNVFAQEEKVKVYKLAVSKMPMSGKPEELLDYEEISAEAITDKVRSILAS
ncbi:transketolase [Candidatus Curtissbacteria bacterium RIFCSPHIGHO2_12_FULL_38_9b]|uniref:Transketolase n=1 Tax=Candidatus Curtissbacteria bacterium RIFCSPHIGHO2_12_FULL_38_9b TaxID=1797720 RepID=A0A1F5GXQ7_9BACT|nr:MAG: transketolase [Candidatus Curtissbacteria bacterium RIFCSPHIGHO2_12_FULL_38_9b]